MLKKLTENLILKSKFVLYKPARCLTATTTINDHEIQHFNKYSSQWWDEMGIMKALHSMNLLRVPFIRDNLINRGAVKNEHIDSSEPLTDLKILDVGCGGGFLSEPLSRLGAKVTGIDGSYEQINVAKEHAVQDNTLKSLTYITSSIEEFSIKNPGVFDAVVASEVIEHVNDKNTFITECVKCLKPGGSIIITTINKTILSRIATIWVGEYILKIVPEGTHEYEKFLEPHVLQRLFESNNCRTTVIHGMFYNPLTNYWYWTGDTPVCYALHAVKLTP